LSARVKRSRDAVIVLDPRHPPWTVDERGCWIPTAGYREKQGYRMFRIGHRRVRAHRVAWMASHHCTIPPGLIVRHSCDNPECVNPEHLMLGTKRENTRDMLTRGRASRWEDRPGVPGHRRRQKLTGAQIAAIRAGGGSSYEVASNFGVSDVEIRRIRNGTRCAGL
jgi:hypothetical protein